MTVYRYEMLSNNSGPEEPWTDAGWEERHAGDDDSKEVDTDAPTGEQPSVEADSFVTSVMLGMT